MEQLEVNERSNESVGDLKPSQELASLLFVLETLQKYLHSFEGHPARKTREMVDLHINQLLQATPENIETQLFKFRSFYESYRLKESLYFQNTVREFKTLIWELVEQLTEIAKSSSEQNLEIRVASLRQSVESDSLEELRHKTLEFIDTVMSQQHSQKEKIERRLSETQKSLKNAKIKLTEAQLASEMDHLTQIHNRKSFDQRLSDLHQLCRHTQLHATLVICDIDHFKSINDRFGHDVGDRVIKECAYSLMSHCTREVEIAARIGGEEFALILPDFSEEQAVIKVNKIQETIKALTLTHEGSRIDFTMSFGVAEFNNNTDLTEWFKAADSALYTSKRNGRNRITKHSELLLKQAV